MTPSALPTLTQVKSAALYAALFCWRTIETAYEEIGQTDRASPRGVITKVRRAASPASDDSARS